MGMRLYVNGRGYLSQRWADLHRQSCHPSLRCCFSIGILLLGIVPGFTKFLVSYFQLLKPKGRLFSGLV